METQILICDRCGRTYQWTQPEGFVHQMYNYCGICSPKRIDYVAPLSPAQYDTIYAKLKAVFKAGGA